MLDDDFPWPEPGRTFFEFEQSRPDADTWMGRSLGDYAYSYLQSAEQLIELASDAPGVVNPYAMPAVFLFRHYVELSLKAMIVDASLLNDEPGSFPDGHQLRNLWSDLRRLMDRAGLDETDEQRATADVVEKMINELDGADPSSMSFRYPVGTEKSGRKELLSDKFQYFDMQTFRDQAKRLSNFLSGSIDYIDAALQAKTRNGRWRGLVTLWAWDEDQDGLAYFLPQARELLAALAPQRVRRLSERDLDALRVLGDGAPVDVH